MASLSFERQNADDLRMFAYENGKASHKVAKKKGVASEEATPEKDHFDFK
jgi:hypothetical protein